MSIVAHDALKDRLFKVFKDSPEIAKLLYTISVAFQDTIDAIDFIDSQKTIDELEGVRLDHLGTRLGVPRPGLFEPQEHLLTLIDETDVGTTWNNLSDQDEPSEGGYLSDQKGLPDQSGEAGQMSDEEYRPLLKQKAASFRKRATRENLFTWLVNLGGRCLIDDDEAHTIVFDPVDYYSLTDFEKWYAKTKGFKPAGISVDFREMMRDAEAI